MIKEVTRLKRAAEDLTNYQLAYRIAAVERRHAALAAQKAGVIMPRIAEHLGVTLSNAYALIDKARNETHYHDLPPAQLAQAVEQKEAKRAR